ncbi:MAG: hypothetical protein AMXMBFR25_31540 [Lysobacterales bacterium]|jgi:hypothetical protein
MNGVTKVGLLTLLASSLGRVRARTWLLLGAAGIVVLGLIVGAGIWLLSWLWGQAPAVVDAGKRLGGEAVTQVEQAAPGLWERLDQWAPGLREQLARWIPAVAPAAPAQDVSGADIGPVPRYPGLVRSHFAREGQTVEVGFVGAAQFDAVLAHYVKGFGAAGYAQQVVAATPDVERHRFAREREIFDLALTRRPGGHVELQLKQSAE